MAEAPSHIHRWIRFPVWHWPVTAVALVALAVFGWTELISHLSRQMDAGRLASDERNFSDQIAEVEAGRSIAIDFYCMHGVNDELGRLKPLSSLRMVFFDFTDISDEGLKSLGRQTSITELVIDALSRSSNVGDSGLASIANLVQLERLELMGGAISGKGLAPLERLPHLRDLKLGSGYKNGVPILSDVALES
jgi:hypothetical protein